MTYSIIQKSKLEGAKRLDAEYYQPEYLAIQKRLNKQPTLVDLASNIICGPFGSAILNADYKKDGIPLLRVGDLNSNFINSEELVFIDKNLSDSLKRYQVFPNDIVVSQRGTVSLFSFVTDDFPKYNISANLISILNSKKTNFLYLLAFLNSKYGNLQLERKISGQVQSKITTDDVKQLLVYLPSSKNQNKIAGMFQEAQKELKNSKLFYKQAENMLLKELGLKDFEIEDKLFNIVNFSDTQNTKRLDAEYFQTKYTKLISKIKNKNAKSLGNLVSIKKGVEPGAEEYQETGKKFIRVSNMSENGINDNNQKYLNEDLYKKLKDNFEPKKNEILLTKDATPGIAYVLKEYEEGIISSGILRLKLKNKNVEDEYLALCLNSILGQTQTERDAGGSVIKHWKPEQIKNVLIPILPQPVQQKIAGLVQKSHQARAKAQKLLEQAKQKVEDLIEK